MAYTAQPSPIGKSTYKYSYGGSSPSPAPAPSPRVLGASTLQSIPQPNWNNQWNDVWNDYWNKGYNQQYGNVSYGGSGEFSTAQSQGYAAGLAKRLGGGSSNSGGNNENSANMGNNQNQGPSWEEEQQRILQEQARIDLENAMGEYGRQAELGQADIDYYTAEKGRLSGQADQQRVRVGEEATLSKKEAEEATTSAKDRSLTAAKDVERKNRNVLRAMGILSSSAAGEMLAKPAQEYQKVAGELETQLVKRKGEVDKWLNDRIVDIDNYVQDIEAKYGKVIEDIKRDLRYNGEQRAGAVRAAQAALQQKMSEVKQLAVGYQQAAQQYNSGILQQIAQIKLYQNPQANVSGILSASANFMPTNYVSENAQIYSDEDYRKRLLSG